MISTVDLDFVLSIRCTAADGCRVERVGATVDILITRQFPLVGRLVRWLGSGGWWRVHDGPQSDPRDPARVLVQAESPVSQRLLTVALPLSIEVLDEHSETKAPAASGSALLVVGWPALAAKAESDRRGLSNPASSLRGGPAFIVSQRPR